MPRQLDVVNAFNFQGGLNVSVPPAQLARNELAQAINVDPLPSGELRERRAWWDTGEDSVVDGDEDSVLNGGIARGYTAALAWFDVNGDGISYFVRPTVHGEFEDSGGNPILSTQDAGADAAQWGDELYFVTGVSAGGANPSIKFDITSPATGGTDLADASAAWANDYTIPSTLKFLRADVVEPHLSYMFVGSIDEGGSLLRRRLRWSHPNDPESWHEDDFIHFEGDGSPITALVSFEDHLLIFMEHQVWGLFGTDADSWVVAKVADGVGAISHAAVAKSSSAVYFANSKGVYVYDTRGVKKISDRVDGYFNGGYFIADSALNEVETRGFSGFSVVPADFSVSIVNDNVWVTVPYVHESTGTIYGSFVMVFYPSQGIWSTYRTSAWNWYGPRKVLQMDNQQVAVTNGTLETVYVTLMPTLNAAAGERLSYAFVEMPPGFREGDWTDQATPRKFVRVITGNQDGGQPAQKKRWRRPELFWGAMDPNADDTATFALAFVSTDEDIAASTVTLNDTPGNTEFIPDTDSRQLHVKMPSVGRGKWARLWLEWTGRDDATSFRGVTFKYAGRPIR